MITVSKGVVFLLGILATALLTVVAETVPEGKCHAECVKKGSCPPTTFEVAGAKSHSCEKADQVCCIPKGPPRKCENCMPKGKCPKDHTEVPQSRELSCPNPGNTTTGHVCCVPNVAVSPRGSEISPRSCETHFGCYNGYCWSRCKGAGAIGGEFFNEWCYTTEGKSQDFNYVRCFSDLGCSGCWACAGSCTV